MSLSYIICAAGHGNRTKVIGKAPKPFLKLHGKTFLEWSIESLPLEKSDQIILVLREADENWVQTCQLPPTIEVLYIKKPTRGQAETALLCESLVKNPSIVVFNCDTFFSSKNLKKYITSPQIDGLIPCSIEDGTEWSFCQINENDFNSHDLNVKKEEILLKVYKVTEKIRISNFCSIGFYYFKDKSIFFELVKKSLSAECPERELYVAPFYNQLIQDQLNIVACLVENFKPFGSMAQIEKYWGLSLQQLQLNNAP